MGRIHSERLDPDSADSSVGADVFLRQEPDEEEEEEEEEDEEEDEGGGGKEDEDEDGDDGYSE
jgi:hypothetical protein